MGPNTLLLLSALLYLPSSHRNFKILFLFLATFFPDFFNLFSHQVSQNNPTLCIGLGHCSSPWSHFLDFCTNFWLSRTSLQIQHQEGHSDRKLPWITPCGRGNDTASSNVFPMLFCIFCFILQWFCSKYVDYLTDPPTVSEHLQYELYIFWEGQDLFSNFSHLFKAKKLLELLFLFVLTCFYSYPINKLLLPETASLFLQWL